MGVFYVKRDFLLLHKLGSGVTGLHPVGADKVGCWHSAMMGSSSVLSPLPSPSAPLSWFAISKSQNVYDGFPGRPFASGHTRQEGK